MQIRSEGLVWQELDGDLVLMDLERSVYLTTNATGTVLAKLLTEERTREELADQLVEQFGADRERALVDVDAFTAQLREKQAAALGGFPQRTAAQVFSMSDQGQVPVPLDPIELRLRSRSGPRSAGRLIALVGRSLRLVWQAGPRQVVQLAVLQLLNAALLAGQVVVVGHVVSAIVELGQGEDRFGDLLTPLVLFAVLTAASAVVTAVQTSTGRALGEAVARLTWREVFAVATSVTLRHFESPEFYDLLQRVQGNATTRPYQVTQALLRILGGLASTIGVGAVLIAINPVLLPLLVIGGLPLIVTNRAESRVEFGFTVDQTANQRERSYLAYVLTGRNEAKEIRAFDLGRCAQRAPRPALCRL